MNDDDDGSEDAKANAVGIMHCLRMLAEEAQSLCLTRTRSALDAAMEICQIEHLGMVGQASGPAGAHPAADAAEPMRHDRPMLH